MGHGPRFYIDVQHKPQKFSIGWRQFMQRRRAARPAFLLIGFIYGLGFRVYKVLGFIGFRVYRV